MIVGCELDWNNLPGLRELLENAFYLIGADKWLLFVCFIGLSVWVLSCFRCLSMKSMTANERTEQTNVTLGTKTKWRVLSVQGQTCPSIAESNLRDNYGHVYMDFMTSSHNGAVKEIKIIDGTLKMTGRIRVELKRELLKPWSEIRKSAPCMWFEQPHDFIAESQRGRVLSRMNTIMGNEVM